MISATSLSKVAAPRPVAPKLVAKPNKAVRCVRMYSGVGDEIKKAADDVADSAKEAGSSAKKAVQDGVDQAKDAASGVKDDVKGATDDAANKISEGARDAQSEVKKAADKA